MSFRLKLVFLLLLVVFLFSFFFILVDVPFDVSNRYLGRLIAMLTLIICVIILTRMTKSNDNF
ncbi:MAG: hypothetical protein CW716_00760 [Candidatus Bathyarchaeum sp.]|nr:MAG: hypothetical protein CW716_00760 [Candidatus Bathyarchaeum sp.]